MNRADPKLVAKLKRYSKDQIIEALGKQYNADYIISGLVNDIEYQQSDRLLKEHGEALDAAIKARREFSEFIREAATKYGDGKSFKVSALPPAVLARGTALEKAVKEAEAKERDLDKKVSKMLKLEE